MKILLRFKVQSLLIRDTSFTRNIFKSNTKNQLNTKTNKNTQKHHIMEERASGNSERNRGHTEVLNEVRGIARQGGTSLPPKNHLSFERIGCIG